MVGVRTDLAWSIQKRDAGGALVWSRTVGSNAANSTYEVADIVSNPDGSFVVFGTDGYRRGNGSNSVSVQKFTKDGVRVWIKDRISDNLGLSNTYVAQAVTTSDGGYLLVGGISSFPNRDARSGWAAKLDGQGNVIWQKQYEERASLDGVIPNPYFNGWFIASGVNNLNANVTNTLNITPDGDPAGGFYQPGRVVGVPAVLVAVPATNTIPPFHTYLDNAAQNGGDFRLTNLAQSDQWVWTKTLGGSGNDVPQDMIRTDDGGYLLVGTTTSTDGDVIGRQSNAMATWIVKVGKAAPANPLTLLPPTYNCQTGTITFHTTGGDGSSITYSAPGISRGNPTDNAGTVEPGLRADPKPIQIQAKQSGYAVSYTFNLSAACNPVSHALPSPILANVPDQTLSVIDQYVSYPPIELGSGAYNPAVSDDYKSWAITATGLPAGFSLRTGVLMNTFFMVSIYGTGGSVGVYPVTVTAVNTRAPNEPTFVTKFTITIVDQPAPGGALTLLAPTYNCQTGAITFNVSGGDGSAITYSAPGITRSSPTSNVGTIESELRADPKSIRIQATQSGVTTAFVFDLPGICGERARRTATNESTDGLRVIVLGNPTDADLTVDVSGVSGQALRLELVDGRGRFLTTRCVEQAGATERHTFDLRQQAPGVLLLRAVTNSQTTVVKVLKK